LEGTLTSILNESDTRRRALIEEIGTIMKCDVISYIANPNASPNVIDHNDAVFMVDILESIGKTERLALILDSPGGEPNSAEKLAEMFREFCDEFIVIVPNSAKSAATMLALASDKILMGYLSEIGPIDPQIRVLNPQGQFTYVPAQSVIDSLLMLNDALKQGIDARTAIALVQKLDPILLDVAQKAIAFSKQFAERWLSKYMLVDKPTKAKKIAEQLSDNRKWLSHGKRIGISEAKGIGLSIESIKRNSRLWKCLWEYYSRALVHMNNSQSIKLYESSKLTLHFNIGRKQPRTS